MDRTVCRKQGLPKNDSGYGKDRGRRQEILGCHGYAGKVVGKFGAARKLAKGFGTVNEIDAVTRTRSYVGELTNWRVQKLTLHAAK
jgi:hypothetical protein